ncbi:hypothetical protein I4U23_010679 [Adineta vaga]|nr:hypothetical protein I4U23_010679 [Adineta vaga]
MEYSDIQLTDLPDEILLLIFKNLTNNQVLFSLLDVNRKLHNIASDPVFTEYLTLLIHSSNGIKTSIDNSMLDRFRRQILPNIHSKIKWLNLEPLSMEHILMAASYPNLYALTLFHIERETDLCLFSDCAFKNQITTVIIIINQNNSSKQISNLTSVVCDQILFMFMNLIRLKIQSSHEWYYQTIERLKFNHRCPTFSSSTLTELFVNVDVSDDLLYLLDGRFNQLHTLHVTVHFLDESSESIRKEKLINLKSFSLTCRLEVLFYDETLVPLLHRMSHLEKLFLNVCIERNIPDEPFIDGNNLMNNIINYIPTLDKFAFSIHSNIDHSNHLLQLPSNDDIQHTFKDFQEYQVVSYIHYLPESKMSQCHIYSYPYYMDSLYRLTNSFPGGLFEFVHKVYLFDEQPFEHEFFLRIAHAFPCLKTLLIDNDSSQKYKQDPQSNGNDQNFKIIKYPSLNVLILNCSHEDYLEQFLNSNKTCLLNQIKLDVDYTTLQTVTHNFTRTLTQINCKKITFIYDISKYNIPEHFYNYFPHIEEL